MKKSLLIAGLVASTVFAGSASAATLITGNNSLEKVFSTGTQNNNTIFGETQFSNVGVSFYSTSDIKVTGMGYAQIQDGNSKDDPFNNLAISLTSSPYGFTGAEFSVQFSSKVTPSNLTIGYELLSGGPVVWFTPINFSNDGVQDWQVLAGTNEVFKTVYLKSDDPMDKVKQVDINPAAAPAVPEPSTWLTMIAGFGLVGISLRRRGVKTQIA